MRRRIDPKRIDSTSYIYIGWVLDDSLIDLTGGRESNDPAWSVLTDGNTALLGTFLTLFDPATNPNGRMFDEDMDANGGTIYRLREGIERFFITDINNPAATARAQSDIALMFDTVSEHVGNFSHVPAGANTLYMDGHVEFLKYPSKFPASVACADTASNVPRLFE